MALAIDLLVCPPGAERCRACGTAFTPHERISTGLAGRHFVFCPCGLRLSQSVHHPVRDALATLLVAALGERMVISESDRTGRMDMFMRRFPAVGRRPDLVLVGFDGHWDSHTLIEVRTGDPACTTHAVGHRCASVRGAWHHHEERTAPGQYVLPAGRRLPPSAPQG